MKFRFDLLLMRAILLNAAGGFLLMVGLDNGTITDILAMDKSYISEAIIAVFGTIGGFQMAVSDVLALRSRLPRVRLAVCRFLTAEP